MTTKPRRTGSFLANVQALEDRPKRFIDCLTPSQRKEFIEMARLYMAGQIKTSIAAIARQVERDFDIRVTNNTIGDAIKRYGKTDAKGS